MQAGKPEKNQWQICTIKSGAAVDANGIHVEWIENSKRGRLRPGQKKKDREKWIYGMNYKDAKTQAMKRGGR